MDGAACNPTAPISRAKLDRWVQRQRAHIERALGMGSPGLTNATFMAGVGNVVNAVNQNATDALDYQRNKHNKSFTDKHGEILAERMHRLCNVTRDEDLPQVHLLLASAPKGRDYTILKSLIQARVSACGLPLDLDSYPIESPSILNGVFRDLTVVAPVGSFGKGLSPFAVVCASHEQSFELQQVIAKASLTEQGAATSLHDAASILTNDVRFPTSAFMAGEKMYGWSVLVDLFHGVNHPIATHVRNLARSIGPMLPRVAVLTTGNEEAGMDTVCRILYDAQVSYFAWASQVAQGTLTAADAPNFETLIQQVKFGRADGLCPLPRLWYGKVTAPKNRDEANSKNSGDSHKQKAGLAPTFYSNANKTLMQRYRDHGSPSIATLMSGKDVKVPTLSNSKEVCLSWALKGSCSATCRRQSQHVTYSKTTNKAIHDLLTACGVAEAAQA